MVFGFARAGMAMERGEERAQEKDAPQRTQKAQRTLRRETEEDKKRE